MAFIDNIDINYSEPFLIKNLVFSFDNNLSTYDASLPVSTFNFDDSTVLVSGSLRQEKIYLKWQTEKPISKNIISGVVIDDGFSGFFANYYDINRNLLYQDPVQFNKTEYSKNTSDIKEIFTLLTGQNNLIDLNQFFIDVVSVSVSGLYSTGVALINFPSSTLSVSSIFAGTFSSSLLSLEYSDKNSIKNVNVFVTKDSDFDLGDTNYLYNYTATFPDIDSIQITFSSKCFKFPF